VTFVAYRILPALLIFVPIAACVLTPHEAGGVGPAPVSP
jgi:hypothetical protein